MRSRVRLHSSSEQLFIADQHESVFKASSVTSFMRSRVRLHSSSEQLFIADQHELIFNASCVTCFMRLIYQVQTNFISYAVLCKIRLICGVFEIRSSSGVSKSHPAGTSNKFVPVSSSLNGRFLHHCSTSLASQPSRLMLLLSPASSPFSTHASLTLVATDQINLRLAALSPALRDGVDIRTDLHIIVFIIIIIIIIFFFFQA